MYSNLHMKYVLKMICKMHANYSKIDDVWCCENQNVTSIGTEPAGHKREISFSPIDKKFFIV